MRITQSFEDLLTESAEEEPCLIEPGILPFSGKMILYGAPKSYKSMMVMQLAFEVANGFPWVGRFPTAQGKVVYLQCEIGRGEFRDRLRKMWIAYPDTPQETLYHLTSKTLRASLSDAQFGRLLDDLDAIRPSLLIVDPQWKTLLGDENNGNDLRDYYNMMDAITESVGCAIVIVTHRRKSQRGDGGPPLDMGFQELKGSSRQVDWPDAIVRLTKGKDKSVLKFEALRNAEEPDPVVLTFDVTTLTHGGQEKEVEKAIREMLDAPVLLGTLLDTLEGQGFSRSTVNRALARMEDVVRESAGGAAKRVRRKDE